MNQIEDNIDDTLGNAKRALVVKVEKANELIVSLNTDDARKVVTVTHQTGMVVGTVSKSIIKVAAFTIFLGGTFLMGFIRGLGSNGTSTA